MQHNVIRKFHLFDFWNKSFNNFIRMVVSTRPVFYMDFYGDRVPRIRKPCEMLTRIELLFFFFPFQRINIRTIITVSPVQ